MLSFWLRVILLLSMIASLCMSCGNDDDGNYPQIYQLTEKISVQELEWYMVVSQDSFLSIEPIDELVLDSTFIATLRQQTLELHQPRKIEFISNSELITDSQNEFYYENSWDEIIPVSMNFILSRTSDPNTLEYEYCNVQTSILFGGAYVVSGEIVPCLKSVVDDFLRQMTIIPRTIKEKTLGEGDIISIGRFSLTYENVK